MRDGPGVVAEPHRPGAPMTGSAQRRTSAAVAAAEDRLRAAGVDTPRLDAELLLSAVLGTPPLRLRLEERTLTAQEAARLDAMVVRRAGREPLQHIVGTVAFRELELRVDARALVPRPETEVLVQAVLDWSLSRSSEPGGLDVLDVGTGTGAIALSLAREGAFRRVVATDLSAEALDLARENAKATGLGPRVEFRVWDVWSAVSPGLCFDIVVSNPPYIAEDERPGLQPEVVAWDPPTALFAEEGGTAILRRLVEGAPGHLRRPGLLALELAAHQAEPLARLAAAGFERVEIRRDLAGRERILLAERSNES